MRVHSTAIQGLKIIETAPYEDARGVFVRLYCERELADLVFPRRIVQVNHSRTFAVGAVRGLHFQHPPDAEMKLVRCLKGRIWDVAVDLRRNSKTFLQWHGEELTSVNGKMILIPEGFAHGFQVLESESELLYLHTGFYNPEAEGALRYNEPSIGIGWPLPVTDISVRDQQHPLINKDFFGIDL